MARERRNYSDEFKQKIVELYNSGKPRAELIHLRKELQRLKMENDILKQAALIMGRK